MKYLLLLLSIFSFCNPLYAENGNMTLQLEVGSPEISITNPDDSIAYYDGLAADLSVIFPTIASENFQISLSGNFRYFDLENTTTADVKETAQMMGPGAGIDIQFYIFNFGYGMQFLHARHQSISVVSNNLEYDFTYTGYHIGLIKNFNRLSIGALMTASTGTISKKETGLSKDSDFSESTIWLILGYDLGTSPGGFFKNLLD